MEWTGGLRRRLVQKLIDYLTEPIPHYERRGWNDPAALKREIRKGDVLLVEGDQRISEVIKYLTQSCWSHAALYIGDELLLRDDGNAARDAERFGEEASHLIVEALPEGVLASPLLKYVDYNVRICRPYRLRPEHLKQIMDEAVGAIGWRYDLRNVFDLARYLFPVSWIPWHLRRTALHFGSGEPTEVICSSLIGRLFQRVRFPILPRVTFPEGPPPERSSARSRLSQRIFGYESVDYTGIFQIRHPTLLTPRDFDLSPYFDIVKFNVIPDPHFDYQRIHWAGDERPERLGVGVDSDASASRGSR